MPGYNCAGTIKKTFSEIDPIYKQNVILIDDGSKDKTSEVSKKLGIKVFRHPKNVGYGGAQKTAYREALKLNPDIVVMVHPDYQHDPSYIKELIRPILAGKYDFMTGSRMKNRQMAFAGGMPKLKYYTNRFICILQNILLNQNFSEYFCGFRAYSRKFLTTVPFQRFSNDFVFDQEMTICAISYHMRIGEISIPTRYPKKSSTMHFAKGVKFIFDGFIVLLSYRLHNWKLIRDTRFK